VLTLDEPDVTRLTVAERMPGLAGVLDDAARMRQVFQVMHGWLDDAPRHRSPHDPDRLYRTHGDPRD
jgi:hypothetical protein